MLTGDYGNCAFQIDQQAAESLRKDEKSETHDEVFETSSKSGSPVSLKDQLRKKTYEGSDYGSGGSQRNSIEKKPSYLSCSKNLRKPDKSEERTSSPSQSLTQQKPSLTDTDWTELLSPTNQGNSTSKPRTSSGTSVIRGLKKDGKRHGNLGKNPSVSDGKRSEKSSGNVVDSRGRTQKQPNKEPSDKEVSSPSDADMENRTAPRDIFAKSTHKESEKDVNAKPPPLDDSTRSATETLPRETLPSAGKKDGRELRRSAVWGKQARGEVSQSNVSDGLKRKGSSLSSDESESDYESDSSTDSERERQREERRRRREKIFAEKVATKAVAVIKERENMVARLEGEKQSLEKIVEERAKQQAQEVAIFQVFSLQR